MQLRSIHIPITLTLIRLIISPLALPFLLVYLLPFNILWLNLTLAGIFALFSLTDLLDGYLARRLKQQTLLGKTLDPIADKFLFYSVLVSLLAVKKIYFYWVIIFIGREFFVMGLRMIALEHNHVIPVSLIGKIRTLSMNLLLAYLIANPYQELSFSQAMLWHSIEYGLFFIAVLLSFLSSRHYYHLFISPLHTRQYQGYEPEYIQELDR